jgi:hypothetical protein
MSCHYPSCMMGGGGCPYEEDCDKEHQNYVSLIKKQQDLDCEEQLARIAYYKANTPKQEGTV